MARYLIANISLLRPVTGWFSPVTRFVSSTTRATPVVSTVENDASTPPLLISLQELAHKGVVDNRSVDNILRDTPDTRLTKDQWSTIRKIFEVKTHRTNMSRLWFPTFMVLSSKYEKDNLNESLVDYVEANEDLHSVPTLLRVMDSYRVKDMKRFRWALSLIENNMTDTLKSVVFKDMIAVLTKSEDWQKAFPYLDHAVKTNQKAEHSYSRVAVAAARFGDWKQMGSVLEKMHSLDYPPVLEFYQYVMEYLDFPKTATSLEIEKKKEQMNDFLSLMHTYEWYMPLKIAALVKNWFEKLPDERWTGQLGMSINKTKCSRCDKVLEPVAISKEACQHLAKGIYDKVIMGDDIYFSTSRKELDKFHRFLRGKRFDCVVDLLNVSFKLFTYRTVYTETGKEVGVRMAGLLERVAEVHKVRRFCLMGKYVPKKFTDAFWKEINDFKRRLGVTVDTFFTESVSHDDVFMMYTALTFGPGCFILSNDEFRQHRFVMGAELAQSFCRWQQRYQINVMSGKNNLSGKNITLKHTREYRTRVQGDMKNGWHIPYQDEYALRNSFEPPGVWLCLHKY